MPSDDGMRVLIGCECSGVIRRAFRDRGHDAWSCDLAPDEDSRNGIHPHHLKCNLLKVLRGSVASGWKKDSLVFQPWDLIIAHPPCRFISVSGMHWTTRGLRDPKETDKAIAFAEAIWNCPCPRVCIENPTSVLSTRSVLGKATQRIQPYQFGHDASKGTCLWLRGLPKLNLDPTQYVQPRMVCKCGRVFPYNSEFKHGCPDCGPGHAKPRWANQTDSGQNRLAPSDHRAADRARTYPGIAAAMAAQWGVL